MTQRGFSQVSSLWSFALEWDYGKELVNHTDTFPFRKPWKQSLEQVLRAQGSHACPIAG